MKGVADHLWEAREHFNSNRIVGIFLQGSQNYGLDYEGSDIDTKLIIVPTFEQIAFNKQPCSTTHIRNNDEHIDFKDIRLYMQTFRKQNLNFLEILFTDFKYINEEYAPYWNILVENREKIARYNLYQAVKSMKGIALEKYHAMEHPYPSKLAILEQYAPKLMGEAEIKAIIEATLAEVGIENPTAKDKGKIMKVLMPKVKGKADGKLVNDIFQGYLQ